MTDYPTTRNGWIERAYLRLDEGAEAAALDCLRLSRNAPDCADGCDVDVGYHDIGCQYRRRPDSEGLDAEIARREASDYQWFPKGSSNQTPSARAGASAARGMQRGELTGLKIARAILATSSDSRPEPLDLEVPAHDHDSYIHSHGGPRHIHRFDALVARLDNREPAEEHRQAGHEPSGRNDRGNPDPSRRAATSSDSRPIHVSNYTGNGERRSATLYAHADGSVTLASQPDSRPEPTRPQCSDCSCCTAPTVLGLCGACDTDEDCENCGVDGPFPPSCIPTTPPQGGR